ncbi:hypothetical protein EYF80_018686 [Liparis tanakae]|uniref:Uncharacterized protein n=1 Tax=Liparis tanakae TaxID=230148 RepID=A0A4Z2I0B0_9TELE|nr:hypothetical protein EYF80_018686 [Liparis tanakae]
MRLKGLLECENGSHEKMGGNVWCPTMPISPGRRSIGQVAEKLLLKKQFDLKFCWLSREDSRKQNINSFLSDIIGPDREKSPSLVRHLILGI